MPTSRARRAAEPGPKLESHPLELRESVREILDPHGVSRVERGGATQIAASLHGGSKQLIERSAKRLETPGTRVARARVASRNEAAAAIAALERLAEEKRALFDRALRDPGARLDAAQHDSLRKELEDALRRTAQLASETPLTAPARERALRAVELIRSMGDELVPSAALVAEAYVRLGATDRATGELLAGPLGDTMLPWWDPGTTRALTALRTTPDAWSRLGSGFVALVAGMGQRFAEQNARLEARSGKYRVEPEEAAFIAEALAWGRRP
jgi:hypothetical protein